MQICLSQVDLCDLLISKIKRCGIWELQTNDLSLEKGSAAYRSVSFENARANESETLVEFYTSLTKEVELIFTTTNCNSNYTQVISAKLDPTKDKWTVVKGHNFNEMFTELLMSSDKHWSSSLDRQNYLLFDETYTYY